MGLLLYAGVSPNTSPGFSGNCSILTAAKYGRTEIVKIILAQDGIDPDPIAFPSNRRTGVRRSSPLIHSIEAQCFEIVQMLLDRGMRPGDAGDVNGVPAINCC